MFKFLSLFAIILFSLNSKAQQSKIDSLNLRKVTINSKIQSDTILLKQSSNNIPILDSAYFSKQEKFKKEFIELRNEVSTLRNNIFLFKNQYDAGVVIGISGIVLTGIALVSILADNKGQNTFGSAGMVAGLGLALTGELVMIDSHRYIGYSGKRKHRVIP
jgi:hypothetical protein